MSTFPETPRRLSALQAKARATRQRCRIAKMLSDEFLRNYYRYADQMFLCRHSQAPFSDLGEVGLDFDIYASGEYSRMLEPNGPRASGLSKADSGRD
jgi:hypothetical protein